MFDRNLVILAKKPTEENHEVLFLKANTLIPENHGVTWLTPEEHAKFIETKEVPTGQIDYNPITNDVVVIAFRGNGQSTFVRLAGGYFEPDKQGKSWAFYEDFIEHLKNAKAVEEKPADTTPETPVVEAAPAEEKPKKKRKPRKKKGE